MRGKKRPARRRAAPRKAAVSRNGHDPRLAEALAQQAATAQILRVIAASRTDAQPVFDVIAQNAGPLCEATDVHIWRRDGDHLRIVASHGGMPVTRRELTIGRHSVVGRAAHDRRVVHVEDLAAVLKSEFPDSIGMSQLGFRTILAVPLLRENEAIGVIMMRRREERRFSNRQLALVRTFADQAVIAIENAWLFQETQARNRDLAESLERETATSEILRVISSSPNDVQPVFDIIAKSAAVLCGAEVGAVTRFDGELIHMVAVYGSSRRGTDALRKAFPRPPSAETAAARTIRDRAIVHLPDVLADPEFGIQGAALASGFRSALGVPMLREGRALGAIVLGRSKVGPFSEREIDLLRTFAAQAVIAIENVRLFTELGARNRDLTDSLEQQTATGEILRVIASSPGRIEPTFDAIAHSAARLCEAETAGVFRFDGEMLHFVAEHGRTAAELETTRRAFPQPAAHDTPAGRAVLTGAIVQIDDIHEDPALQPATHIYRTVLSVPLLRQGRPVGVISLARRHVRRFSDQQVALIQTFADQAVIAVENAHLFQELERKNRDLTETLEQQTATGEILRVISSSPTDVKPVFDAIAAAATTLCDAENSGVFLYDGSLIHFVAHHNWNPVHLEAVGKSFPRPPGTGSLTARAILTRAVAHSADISRDPEYQVGVLVEAGFRAVLSVPMLRDGEPIGAINVTRRHPIPFSDAQIALLETFAAQAVIAIHNVRLFQELDSRNHDLTESLEQQTATGEILEVISGSPTDVQPVFDAVASSAARLCDAFDSAIFRRDGDRLLLVAHHGPILVGRVGEFSLPLVRGTAAGRTVLDGRAIHVADMQGEAVEFPESADNATRMGFRTILSVPLMREGLAIGTIQLRRTDARPFSGRQVALLQTFASQAVIAIENTRLFTELDARNRDLTETLDQQTATGEILRAISGSPTDVQPVFDAIARSARRLCSAEFCQVFRAEEGQLHNVANDGQDAEGLAAIRATFPRPVSEDSAAGRAVITAAVAHIADVQAEPGYDAMRATAQRVGFQSIIAVPILHDGVPMGSIAVGRAQSGRFPERQIELLKTFADQAVIAIENVRLFHELEVRNRDLTETLEQQTATGEILRVISSSPQDVQPVFDTIAQSAKRLCEAEFAFVFRYDGELVHFAAQHGLSPEGLAALTNAWPAPLDGGTAASRAIRDRVVAHIPDIRKDSAYAHNQVAAIANFRSVVAIPMLRDGEPIGAITVNRPHPGAFPTRLIELLKTFADQAVIAIENVRLFKELELRNRDLTETLEQQTATGEILRVISSSPTDAQPVFDTIADSASRLCDARCFVFRFDGEKLHFVAQHGLAPEQVEPVRRAWPRAATRGTAAGRAVVDRAAVHIPDVAQDDDYELGRVAQTGAWRATAAIPMLRDGAPIGAISLLRSDPGPFSERQIDLLRTFADQAVIAIENVRLFKELEVRNHDLTQTLEQQTATSEILRVISGSPTDVSPVFETIVERARHLCEADSASLLTYDGALVHLSAMDHANAEQAAALRAAYPMPATRGHATGRAILTGLAVHIPDVSQDPEYVLSGLRDTAGLRTLLAVPMIRDGAPIGTITVQRWGTPRPFSDNQIALLKTFAEQAVIAIQNVHLFNELEVRNRDLTVTLEQQTATGEILRVISSSPTDVQPVFDTIVERAHHLCDSDSAALFTYDGALVHLAALDQASSEQAQALRGVYPMPATPGHATGRAIVTGRPVHIPDVREDPAYTLDSLRGAVALRTLLAVPMIRDGAPIGTITVQRWGTPRPFSDNQIALLETFAEQAVIAIENVRLFKELEVRNRDLTVTLEQQTATGEILRVISSSPTDVQPVFDTIAQNTKRLCAAEFCHIFRFDGGLLHFVGHHGLPPEGVEAIRRAYPLPPGRSSAAARAVLSGQIEQIPDIEADPDYAHVAIARLVTYRSIVAVPLMQEGRAIGAIAAGRSVTGLLPERQLELLKTFADQAVIAIQNVRLFQELDARTLDLTRSVGELKALGEVSQAVSSTLDLETVLATIVSRAVQLSGSYSGIVYEYDEATETFHARGTHQITPDYLEVLRAAPIHLGEGAMGTAAIMQKPVQVADIQDERQLVAPQARAHLVRQGLRSLLAMPLIRDGRLLGGLVILRREAGAFPPDMLATMQTFATQSVLAIQNARLFVEIQRQKQYSDVLVESSPVAIATMDLQGMVVGWNPAAERLFGYSSADAVGRSMEELVATPEIRDDVRGNVERTLAGEWIRDITRRVRNDGALIDVEISSVPVIVEGARVGMIAIYHDITELLLARREAEAANEAKSAFLATMSHEIRTPMNAVIGMSGLLLNTSLTPEQREYAEIVRQSSDTLLTVINDILDFSKIEAGRLELETQPFDLRECVEGALDLVATRAAEKGLDLAYLLGEGTPGAIVGDVTRLRQVLLNLLSNAVKFTERGEVVLSVVTRRPDGAGGLPELTFSVRDTGIGIPEDRIGRLFQSFSQVDASTTRRYGGTGLGLAISQRLTELMGGHITVTSGAGVGSEFRFTLRATPAAVPVPTRRDLTGVQPSLRGKRVLVVDDNATNRRILASHLEAWGMLARVSESPLEALGWLRGGERFDLGILDMHMPEMDGVALAHAIRERADGPVMPLILFTSLGRREARAEEEGFAAYLHKPIKPSMLFDGLISVLGDQPVHVPQRGTVRSELDPEMATRHPLRILLAEDNVVNQKVASRLLGQMGYRADIASNGLEAVAAVERQIYDVVLMDVQMPEMDGFEASREINRRWPSKRPRIVAMTANAMEGDRELCEAAGMDDYVAKPIRIEELVAALGRCQTREDATPRPAATPAAPAVAADVVDRAVIDRLGESMGRDFAVELIDTFGADARDLVTALRLALAATDRDGFRRAAHTLKSTGESLGAFALAGLARELETIGQAGRLHEVGNRVDRLADLYERVAHALGAIRRDLSA